MFSPIKSAIVNVNKCVIRSMSYRAIQLQYAQYGEPAEVIKTVETTVEEPGDRQILVKILASPINPADINTIQGKYPVKPALPAVGGNECVAEVIKVGAGITEFKVCDRVIPFALGLGTWRSHALYSAEQLLKIPQDVGIVEACTITVNPCTAFRMLKDFVTLQPGDTVIQNGANSAVGQAVAQLCKIWNINCIGIVRNRPGITELRNQLKSLGSAEVLTEEELRTTTLFKDKTYAKPKLGLNCVGGKSALEVSRQLDQGGVLVTYGGMSREPVTVPTASLIFKNIEFRGFWMTRWTKENFESTDRQVMFDELFQYIRQGQFKGPTHKLIPFGEYKSALSQTLDIKGFVGQKFVLDFSK